MGGFGEVGVRRARHQNLLVFLPANPRVNPELTDFRAVIPKLARRQNLLVSLGTPEPFLLFVENEGTKVPYIPTYYPLRGLGRFGV